MSKIIIILGLILLNLPVYSQEKFVVYFDYGYEIPNKESVHKLENRLDVKNNISIIRLSEFSKSFSSKAFIRQLATKNKKP